VIIPALPALAASTSPPQQLAAAPGLQAADTPVPHADPLAELPGSAESINPPSPSSAPPLLPSSSPVATASGPVDTTQQQLYQPLPVAHHRRGRPPKKKKKIFNRATSGQHHSGSAYISAIQHTSGANVHEH
jgi:hypothetical protein